VSTKITENVELTPHDSPQQVSGESHVVVG
jgi:hypothetical protein